MDVTNVDGWSMRPGRGHDLNSDIISPVSVESGFKTVGITVTEPSETHLQLFCLLAILETGASFHAFSDFIKHLYTTYALDFSGRSLSDHQPIRLEYRMSRCLKYAFPPRKFTRKSAPSHSFAKGTSYERAIG